MFDKYSGEYNNHYIIAGSQRSTIPPSLFVFSTDIISLTNQVCVGFCNNKKQEDVIQAVVVVPQSAPVAQTITVPQIAPVGGPK